MTILYILSSTEPSGGATKSFLTLLHNVIKAGVEPIVIVPDRNGVYTTLSDMHIEVFETKYDSYIWPLYSTLKDKLLFLPRAAHYILSNKHSERCIQKYLQGRKIDIVHCNSSVVGIGYDFACKRNIPIIYHIREYGDKDFGIKYIPSKKNFDNRLKNKGVYSICITKDIQKHHGIDNDASSCVIYNGIIDNTNGLPMTGINRDNFLYASRLEPTKGLLDLLAAYKDYVKSVSNPLSLYVAGRADKPQFLSEVNDFIIRNRLSQYVKIIGCSDKMAELYSKAKAIVVPSKFEGFGRTMPEAMSYGCIVIGRDTGGTKEQFDNGLSYTGTEIGLRFKSHQQLVNALIKVHNMTNDDSLKIKQDAYATICHLYSSDSYSKRVMEFYNNILNKLH